MKGNGSVVESSNPLGKPYVLVVDDQPEQLGALLKALQSAGYNLLIAQSGGEALQLLAQVQPDVILLDVTLPDMDGFDICRQLKGSQALRDIPVLFATAAADLASKLEGFRAGGADYITKPFQFEEVLARVGAHFTLRRLQKELAFEKERLQGLSNASFEGILLHDQGRILDANQTLEQLTGYSRQELLERNLADLLPPEWRGRAEELTDPRTPSAHEIDGQRKDGGLIALEMQSRLIRCWGRSICVSALRDISWRKELEGQARRLESENVILKASLSDRDHLGELVGRGPVMQKVYERLLKAALSDAPVVIYGETGSGKELAARTIWQLSEKFTDAFVPVNCAALQETLFESQFFGHRKGAFTGAIRDQPGYLDQARGGVLFLDEISELPPPIQAKLLRVLNNGEYTPVGDTVPRYADVRIIAATNQPLRSLTASGRFRQDLFYRLHVIGLDMPPLRQHKEDLPLLVAHFMRQMSPGGDGRRMLPEKILARFRQYDWPGNVRELTNEVRRYMAMDEIELQVLVSPGAATGPLAEGHTLHEQMAAFERQTIAEVLASVSGNRNKASELLKIPLPTLYRKIQKYRL